jgi:membrane protein
MFSVELCQEPDSPLRTHVRTALLLLKRSGIEFWNDNCAYMAAAISYYVLFSLFPLLLFLLSLFGLFVKNPYLKHEVIETVIGMIPFSGTEENTVAAAIQRIAVASSETLSVMSLLLMAWTASNMFGAIRHSINITFHLTKFRPAVRQKLFDIGMIFGLGFFFLLSIGATAFIESLRRLASTFTDLPRFPALNRMIGEAGVMWGFASYAVPMILSLAAFVFAYWIIPAKRIRFRMVLPGAVVAAVLFEGCKSVFVYYLENFAGYDLIFGSLAAVVGFLFWVYIGALILLFGAEIASHTPGFFGPAT